MNPRCALLGVVLFAGCKDSDADGIRDGRDCAPRDHHIHPDATEVCNGADDDCDGQVDEGVAIVGYWDRDRDGYGDDAYARRVCALPEDGSPVGGDCDDLDPNVFPGAEELCDGRDGDCDGEPDSGVALTWFSDGDGDGHGVPGAVVQSCTAPPGMAATDDDCDDTEPLAWTGAPEACDGVDNNCDGSVDEGHPLTRMWADVDGDGYGDPDAPILACGPGRGASDNTLDCDDADASESPATIEIQGNAQDEDCDGWVDEYGVGPGNPYATIEDALAAAPNGAVVQLDAGFFVATADLTGRDVTFAGEGCGWTVLYADGAGSAVRVDHGEVMDMTISGGTGTLVVPDAGEPLTRGGGVLVSGSVTLERLCIEGNEADEGGGLTVEADASVFASELTIADNSAELGGGILVAGGASLSIDRSRVVGNDSSGRGGGIGTKGSLLTVTNTVVAGNTCTDRSCGIDVRGESTLTTATLTNVTLHANAYVGSDDVTFTEALGSGARAEALLTNVLVTFHPNALGSVVDTYRAGVPPTYGTITSSFLGFGSNAGSDYEGPTWELTRTGGDPMYVNADPALAPSSWDLRLRADSPYQDAGDPALLDPDGSPSDIGAFGGPGAPAGWDVGQTDADGDLLLDGWEIRFATNPWVDDAADDPDLDGFTNLDEQLAGGDPHVPAIAGSAPIADAGRDRVVPRGDAQVLDAGASSDPDGDPWTAAWTVVSAPMGSAASIVDPAAIVTSFAPDLVGTYTMALAIDDGSSVATDTVELRVLDGSIVPDDHPTLQEAVDAAADGEAVWIRPGRWDGPVETSGRELTLAGLSIADDVIVDGHSAGSVVTHAGGGSLLLAHLTLTAGRAITGGGVYVDGLDSAELHDVILARNFADDGGGLWAMDTPLVVSDTRVHDNHATIGGGGMSITGNGIESLAVVRRTTFHGNTAGATGGALHVAGQPTPTSDSDLVLESVACVANEALEGACWWHTGDESHLVARNVWLAGNVGASVGEASDGFDVILSPTIERNDAPVIFAEGVVPRVLQVFDGFLWANTVDEPADPVVDPEIPDTNWVVADPLSTFVDEGLPDDPWGLRLFSAATDAGFVDDDDPDGSRADAGACGGPAAPLPCLRWSDDADADGVSDGWEIAFGLDATVADGASDGDGDGLSNLAEHAAGTRPDLADTDLDGMDDATETVGAGDPRDDRDHRPRAEVANDDVIGSVGLSVTLDASPSSDPDGDPVVVWSWTFLSAAPGSVLTDADIAGGASASFVPDVPGTWQIGLIVTAGGASSRELVLHVTAFP